MSQRSSVHDSTIQILGNAVLAVVLVVGCAAPEIDLGELQAPIVNGQPYSGHPSVGQLQIGFGGLCTATLVGERTVLTAAHCIGGNLVFHVGGQSYPAQSSTRHPQYNDSTLQNDIAVVILQSAPSVTPSPIANSAPTLGQEVTLIGYGVTSEYGSDSGVKRIATNSIDRMDTGTITFLGSGNGTGNTCYGDSGGPAFATLNGHEVVVGVTSGGTPPCGSDGTDTRVDTYASWVVQTANGDVQQGSTEPPEPQDTRAPAVAITSPAAGAVVAPSVTVASTITDDVGVVSAQLHVNGSPTATLNAPPFNFTVTLAEGAAQLRITATDDAGNVGEATVSVTVRSDAPPTPDPPTPDPPQAGAFGASCDGPADCDSGLCAADPDGGPKYCTQSCNPTMNNCPQQAECLGSSAGGYVCGPPAGSPSPTPPLPNDPTPPSNGLDGQQLIGSCQVSPGAAPPTALTLLLGLALLLRLRRRKR